MGLSLVKNMAVIVIIANIVNMAENFVISCFSLQNFVVICIIKHGFGKAGN